LFTRNDYTQTDRQREKEKTTHPTDPNVLLAALLPEAWLAINLRIFTEHESNGFHCITQGDVADITEIIHSESTKYVDVAYVW